jgi:hypothetical protein
VRRGGPAEAGFSIEYKDGKISIINKVDSLAAGTLAHGFPESVRSRRALYVTIPTLVAEYPR